MKIQILLIFCTVFLSGFISGQEGAQCSNDRQCCEGFELCEFYCSRQHLCADKTNIYCSGVGAPCSSANDCCGNMRCSAPTGITGFVCN